MSALLPQVKEFKYHTVLFTSVARSEHEIDRWLCAVAAVMPSCLDCRGEERTRSESKAFDLPIDLCSKPHLGSRALGSDKKSEIVGASSQK